MELGELTVVNGVVALALTVGLTKLFTLILESLGLAEGRKFAPLFTVVAAAIAVAVLIDRDATGQDFWLATIVVALIAVGAHSGGTNVEEGIRQMVSRS